MGMWLANKLSWPELQKLAATAQTRADMPQRNKRKRDSELKMEWPSKGRMWAAFRGMSSEPFGDPQPQQRVPKVGRPANSAAAAAYQGRENLNAAAKRALEDLLAFGSAAPMQSHLPGAKLEQRKPLLDRMARILHGGVVETPDGTSLMARAEWPVGEEDPDLPPMLRIWFNIGEAEKYSEAFAADRKALGVKTHRWAWHLLQQHDSELEVKNIRHRLFRDDAKVRAGLQAASAGGRAATVSVLSNCAAAANCVMLTPCVTCRRSQVQRAPWGKYLCSYPST